MKKYEEGTGKVNKYDKVKHFWMLWTKWEMDNDQQGRGSIGKWQLILSYNTETK